MSFIRFNFTIEDVEGNKSPKLAKGDTSVYRCLEVY